MVALCLLCAWQWHRETELRKVVADQSSQLESLQAERDEIEARVRTADAAILQLTGSINELRANSITKKEQEEVMGQNKRMSEVIGKQSALITDQNAAITKANTAIQQANETIKKVTLERDSLAKQLNDVTARYNALGKKN
jgi:chromosome segregation ATPase